MTSAINVSKRMWKIFKFWFRYWDIEGGINHEWYGYQKSIIYKYFIIDVVLHKIPYHQILRRRIML